MVLRSFAAFDNEAFTVTPGSPSGTPGSAIINNSSTPVNQIFEFNAGFPYQTITLNDTSSTPDVFNDDDEGNHVITNGGSLVSNGTEVESESYHFLRQIDSSGNQFGPTITITVFSQNGQTSNIWGMASDTELIPGAQYQKTGGSNNGDSLYDTFVPCFTTGALIATQHGERRIEDIRVGDRVITRDNGMQEVRWIGTCMVDGAMLRAQASKRPVRVAKDTFGPGMPERDMHFSPNHRILLAQADTSLLFGDPEVLAAVKDMVDRPGISRVTPEQVTYVHLLFDRHETVFADGMWSESFLPGKVAMNGLDQAQQVEIYDLFPELKAGTEAASFLPARRILKRHEVMVEA